MTTTPLPHPPPHQHQGQLGAERSAGGRHTQEGETGVAYGPQPHPWGRERQPERGLVRNERSERLDYEGVERRHIDDAAPEPSPPPPSGGDTAAAPVVQSGLEGRGGGGGGDDGSGEAKAAPSSLLPMPLSLRGRAVRAWWRGLSCGVCFAAGAWAREGSGVFGVALALAAVCGENILHERMGVP